MDEIWAKLYAAAKAVQQERQISDYVLAGGVAAAVLSKSGKIYTGVCIDTCSTLGICAERNAIFNMITNGEQEIDKVLCILPDGSGGAPCGACRELMVQLMPADPVNVAQFPPTPPMPNTATRACASRSIAAVPKSNSVLENAFIYVYPDTWSKLGELLLYVPKTFPQFSDQSVSRWIPPESGTPFPPETLPYKHACWSGHQTHRPPP